MDVSRGEAKKWPTKQTKAQTMSKTMRKILVSGNAAHRKSVSAVRFGHIGGGPITSGAAFEQGGVPHLRSQKRTCCVEKIIWKKSTLSAVRGGRTKGGSRTRGGDWGFRGELDPTGKRCVICGGEEVAGEWKRDLELYSSEISVTHLARGGPEQSLLAFKE